MLMTNKEDNGIESEQTVSGLDEVTRSDAASCVELIDKKEEEREVKDLIL